jgi:hypothetical protein
MTEKTEKTYVVVVWAKTQEKLDEGFVHILTGYGGPRVYEKDKLDNRVSPEDTAVPFAKTWQEAVNLMGGERIGKMIQLEQTTARRIGLFK